jgi:E3 ubiquitin-protein ligase RNF115/126
VLALDEIMTQLMENSNSGRPVPATDEIIENLPREILEVGCTKAIRPFCDVGS